MIFVDVSGTWKCAHFTSHPVLKDDFYPRPHKIRHLHKKKCISLIYARRALGAPYIVIFQEMARKCLELDNLSVFHMMLCVACFIVLTVKKL